jgi:hypothetical protein
MADPPAPVRSRIDPHTPTIATILGKKGSGKSVLARRLWDTWPYDRLAIDPHNDLHDEHSHVLRDPLPVRLPAPLDTEDERGSWRYVPDPGSRTYVDDLDRAVGLAFNHRRTLLWCDEVGDLTRAAYTPPFMRRALHQSRHRQLSMLLCGPRSIDINPMVIAQADLLYVFDMPHPRDRERVAEVIGYPPKDFAGAVQNLDDHEYLRWDGHELVHFPKLPFGARSTSSREAAHASDPPG